jgi:hypothetical protein
MVNGSVTPVRPPDSNTAAPDAIAVEPRDDPLSPSAVLLLIAMTPAETVVSPVYVLAFDNVNVPTPVFFVSVPVPEMIPDNV